MSITSDLIKEHDYIHVLCDDAATDIEQLELEVEQQAAQIEALTDRNKQLQSKLLDARLAGADRTRLEPEVESRNVLHPYQPTQEYIEKVERLVNEQAAQIEQLRTGDTCGRSCEGQAYRIEARQEKARADELQKEVDALTAERHKGLSLDALNKRIDSYFA